MAPGGAASSCRPPRRCRSRTPWPLMSASRHCMWLTARRGWCILSALPHDSCKVRGRFTRQKWVLQILGKAVIVAECLQTSSISWLSTTVAMLVQLLACHGLTPGFLPCCIVCNPAKSSVTQSRVECRCVMVSVAIGHWSAAIMAWRRGCELCLKWAAAGRHMGSQAARQGVCSRHRPLRRAVGVVLEP